VEQDPFRFVDDRGAVSGGISTTPARTKSGRPGGIAVV
jgi:hypothetical protein